MNIKLLCKKTYKSLLALMIMFSMFPQFTETVVAEETLPVDQFATVDQLKSFNTNDDDGVAKSAKVYFGQSDQQWWIAGSQDDNSITLFAASPLATEVQFQSNENNGVYNGQDVYANHYGASDIRNKLKELETSYFTSAEQDLMNDTTIYTNDTKNNSVYSTTDKLYLAYGVYKDKQYITVGRNSQDSLNDGLRVDNSYWCSWLWLREPWKERQHTLGVGPNSSVEGCRVGGTNDLVPAFGLDMSSVEFASAVPAVSSGGSLELQDTDGSGAFTLRFKSGDLGLALYNNDKSKVTLSGVQPGTFLVVQNNTVAKAIDITGKTEVKASELDLTDFVNCKVWLEKTTEDRITYATFASNQQEGAVAIVGTTYYNNLEDAINGSSPENPAIMLKDVTETSNGYSIKKDNAVLETNGFTLEFNANWSIIGINFNQTFTIKGSGDKDKPDLVIGQLWVNSGNEEVDKNKGLFLYDVYLKNSHEWYDTLLFSPCHLYIENCKIDTVPKYGENKKKQNAIYIRNNGGEGVAEFYGENILVGDIKVGVNATETVYGSLKFIDGSLKKEILFFPDLYGVENSILSTIELPSNWEWVEPNKAIIVENWEPITTIKEQARFNIPQDQYDYSGNDGYDKDNNCINKQVYITVLKANEWVTYPDIEEWIYGEEPKTPTATAKYGTAKFVYCDKEDGIYTEEAPTKPGTYYLKGIVEVNDLFNGYSGLESDPIEFKILKKNSSISFNEGININKTYDGNQVIVSDEHVNKTGSTGNVSFVFEKKEDDAWVSLSEAPSDAGTYRVKSILNEDDEYATATSDPVTFTIAKASSEVTITSNLDKTYDGNKVNEPTYQTSGSTGSVSINYQEYKDNNWNDLTKAPTSVGKYRVVVKVEEDTNYNSASDTKIFTISKADNTWIDELTISGWTYGEKANKPNASTTFGTVNYTYSESKDGTYVDTVPTNAGTYYVKAEVIDNENYTGLTSDSVEFTISKANTTISFTKENIDKVYDSKPIDTPEVTKTGSTKDLTFKWLKKDGTELADKPSDVGEYTLKVSVEEDDNYNSASVSKDFVITIADNTWANKLTINGWTYGETANKPSASSTFGTVEYTYSESKDDTYTSTVPTNAGTYYVKATVDGTLNYKGLVSEAVEFTILKANTTLSITSSIDKTYDGNTVSDPKYKLEGNTNTVTIEWLNKDGTKLTDKPSEVGEYKVVVKVEEDTNYNSASDTKVFTISKADNTWTNKLSIKNWVYGQNPNTPTAKSKFGDVVFSYSESKDGTYTSAVPTKAGIYYVKATVIENENYTGLESVVSFEIKKADSSINFKNGASFDKTYDKKAVVITEEHVDKKGSTAAVDFTLQKKVNDAWQDVNSAIEAGTYKVTASLSGDDNHNSAKETTLEFVINKADSNVTITTKSLDKTYDGTAVATPEYEKTGSDGKVSIKYQEYKVDKWVDLTNAPTNVGKYKVVVTFDGNDNYNSASKELEFTISKVTNTWTEEPTIKGWAYGETSNKPTAKAKFGTVTYTYSDKENGAYTSDVPSNAGTYYVKASVLGNENYTGLESVVSFEILKADPVLKALDTITIEEGKALKSLSLPEGYKWKNPNYECKDLGTYTYKAIYTPKDNVNYNVLDVEVSVKVIAKSVETSPVTPSITNNNNINNTNHTYNGNGTSSNSSALKELSEVVSKSEYKANEKAYTKDSYDNYLNAFENAERVLNNKNSSKEEIKVALNKLNEAILNLKVDKSNLQASLVELEELDSEKYSEASYKVLLSAIEKAKAIMEDEKASPEEIANAIKGLNNAYSSLQSAEPKVEVPKKSSVGKVALITTVTTVVVAGGGSYLWILLKKSRGMK